MKKESIKYHLSLYSIFNKRKTTINHAFASALAPNDNYDEKRLTDALSILGQSSGEDLHCVYCGKSAETWDHVVGLVRDSKFSGFGHQIGNLIPCCKECNSRKGNKSWRDFLARKIVDEKQRAEIEERIEGYVRHYVKPISIESLPECKSDLEKYNQIKEQIFLLMKQADEVASEIRKSIVKRENKT